MLKRLKGNVYIVTRWNRPRFSFALRPNVSGTFRQQAEPYATKNNAMIKVSASHVLPPEVQRYLKEGLRWELLDGFAYAVSDTEAAKSMMRAKAELLRGSSCIRNDS